MVEPSFDFAYYTDKLRQEKKRISVGNIGQDGHGKTTLTTAIAAYYSVKKNQGVENQQEALVDDSNSLINTGYIKYETAQFQYEHVDHSKHIAYVKGITIGADRIDAAVVLVAADSGPEEQTLKQLLLARTAGVRQLIVFINKIDLVAPEQIEYMEQRVINLLISNGYPKDTPIIKGSAYKALTAIKAGNLDSEDTKCIQKLLDTMDSYFSQPVCETDKPFLMAIANVAHVPGHSAIFSGRVERGVVRKDDEVEFIGIRNTFKTTVKNVQEHRKEIPIAKAGQNIGMTIYCKDKLLINSVRSGNYIVKPGSIKLHSKFKAIVYVLTKEEGGSSTPITKSNRLVFSFEINPMVIQGAIKLEGGVGEIVSGKKVVVDVELTKPIFLGKGLYFSIFEGGKTVATGLVAEIFEGFV